MHHWDNQHRATPEAPSSQANWSCPAAALELGTMPHALLQPSSSISSSLPSYSTGTSGCPAREDRRGSCLPFGSSVITRVDEGFSKSGPYREAFASHLAKQVRAERRQEAGVAAMNATMLNSSFVSRIAARPQAPRPFKSNGSRVCMRANAEAQLSGNWLPGAENPKYLEGLPA